MLKYVSAFGASLLLLGCTSYGNISNHPVQQNTLEQPYDLSLAVNNSDRSHDMAIILAFSGGGTRAAALSYGVLEALRDIQLEIGDSQSSLLEQVDVITSVSGGSFTAAYYGLYGDDIFDSYEDRFLRRNVAGELMHGLFSPRLWFSKHGRTEMAINYYERTVFDGATFSDMQNSGGPLIVINASDLGKGLRFSFTQEFFNLLCSDLNQYPVARAVTASSAVPVLFNPVILENYDQCSSEHIAQYEAMLAKAETHQEQDLLKGLLSYSDKAQRPYIHLVDGGITDNLGLLAISEMTEAAGGMVNLNRQLDNQIADKLLLVSVNASTKPQYNLEQSNQVPSVEQTISAMSDAQLHRYNAATIDHIQEQLKQWEIELSSEEQAVNSYFVDLNFNGIVEEDKRLFFNEIPTTFSLSEEQVNELISAGRQLLYSNPVFRQFVSDLQADAKLKQVH